MTKRIFVGGGKFYSAISNSKSHISGQKAWVVVFDKGNGHTINSYYTTNGCDRVQAQFLDEEGAVRYIEDIKNGTPRFEVLDV